MSRLKKYYGILQVNPDATVSDLKSAYRKRAKELHPDINRAENAQEQFVLLNEAFEYLKALREGSATAGKRRRQNAEYARKARQAAQQRAREYSKMRYQEFINSNYYKRTMAYTILLDHAGVVFAATIFFIIPVISILFQVYAFSLTLVLGLFFLPNFISFFKQRETIGISNLVGAIRYVFPRPSFLAVIQGGVAAVLFFTVVMNTLIPWFLLLPGVLVMLAGIGLYSYKLYQEDMINHKKMIYAGAFPLLLNTVFLLNFCFTTSPRIETYTIKGGVDATAYISLKDNQYQYYPALRFFVDYNETVGQRYVTYKIEKGLLGIDVLTDYEFSR